MRALRPGDHVAGHEILDEIGRGCSGIVYRARDPQLEREVAIKVPLPELAADPAIRDEILRRAAEVGGISHRYLVTLYQAGMDHDRPYVCMELLGGGCLADRLSQAELPLLQAVTLLRQVAEAVQAIHLAGSCHGRIEPASVLLTDTGSAHLADLGLDWQTRRDPSGFEAPETRPEGRPDRRSDLYSLGLLFQAALGTSRTRDVPPPLRPLLERLLADDPDQRGPTIGAVVEELSQLETTLKEQSLDLSGHRSSLRTTRSGWIGGIAGLILTGLGLFALLQGRPSWQTAVLLGIGCGLLSLGAVLLFEGRPHRWITGSRALWPYRLSALVFGCAVALLSAYWVEAVRRSEPIQTLAIGRFVARQDVEEGKLLETVLPILLEENLWGRRGLRIIPWSNRTAEGTTGEAGLPPRADGWITGELESTRQGLLVHYRLKVGAGGVQRFSDSLLLPDGAENVEDGVDRIARRLLLEIYGTPQEEEEARSPLTDDQQALQAYLAGLAAKGRASFNEARVAFRQAVDRDDQFAKAWLELASVATDPQEKEVALQQAMRCRFRLSEQHRMAIEAQYTTRTDGPEAALEAYQSWVRRFPGDPEALAGLIEIYEGLDQPERVLETSEALLAIGGEHRVTALISLTGAQLNLGRFDEALIGARTLTREYSEEANGWRAMATIRGHQGKRQAQLENLEKALERASTAFRLRLEVALVQAELGQLQRALDTLDALEAAQTNEMYRASARAERAQLLYRFGLTTQANEALERARESDPTLKKTHWLAARLALERGDEAIILRSVATLEELNDGDGFMEVLNQESASFARAYQDELRGDLEKAEKTFRHHGEMGSSRELIDFLFRQGRWDEAAAEVDRLLDRRPHDLFARMTRFRIAVQQGEGEMAERLGAELLEIWQAGDPDFPWRIEVEAALEAR